MRSSPPPPPPHHHPHFGKWWHLRAGGDHYYVQWGGRWGALHCTPLSNMIRIRLQCRCIFFLLGRATSRLWTLDGATFFWTQANKEVLYSLNSRLYYRCYKNSDSSCSFTFVVAFVMTFLICSGGPLLSLLVMYGNCVREQRFSEHICTMNILGILPF